VARTPELSHFLDQRSIGIRIGVRRRAAMHYEEISASFQESPCSCRRTGDTCNPQSCL
jgi:hypothetical protein